MTPSRRLLNSGLIIMVLLGGFWLRTWALDSESIWHDEGWSIRAIRGPFSTPDDNTPFVYYFTGHLLWKLGAGESVFAFRYTSVLLGLLTVALSFQIARRFYGNRAGLIAASLVAISPLLWDYSQEVRAYVMVPSIALLLLYLADQLLQHPPEAKIPRHQWIALFIVELIGIYTHNLVIPLIFWLNIAISAQWFWQRHWRHLLTWTVLHIALIVGYIPWLLTQSPSGTPLNTVPAWNLKLAQDIWYSYFLPILPQLQAANATTWLNLGGLIFIMSSFLLIWQQRQTRTWLILSQAWLLPILTTLLLQAAHIDFHPRYYIAAIPATLISLIAGIDSLQSRLNHTLTTVLMGLMLLGGLGLSTHSLQAIRQTREYQHDDFAGLAAYYATLPADAMILIPFNREPALQDYYAHSLNIHAQFINIPLYSDESQANTALAKLELPRHIEFLTWFQLPADVRGMYPCLLGANSNSVQNPRYYFGLASQAFQLNRLAEFNDIPTDGYFFDQGLNLAWQSSDAGLCIRSQWQAPPLQDELSATIHILNTENWTIAESNTVARTAKQLSSAELVHANVTSSLLSTYHWLQLPAAAPQALYALEFGIYSPTQSSGYDFYSNSGQPLGKFYRSAPLIDASGPPLDRNITTPELIHDTSNGPIDSGTPLAITLLLPPHSQELRLVGTDWELTTTLSNATIPQLAWHSFQLPLSASGEADLWVDATRLKTYTIASIERILSPPDFEIPINTSFTAAGTLLGATLAQASISHATPPEISLIWQADNASTIPYTVFVQLLDPTGRLIAQSDQQPMNAQRPTTGWLTGEYIIDTHRLHFVVDDYTGSVELIVGLYDPISFERLTTLSGETFATLPIQLHIE